MNLRHRLLWIDGLAGLSAGVVMVLASGWLSSWYGLPTKLLLFTGVVNLAYGSYSLPLARRRRRPLGMIVFLVAANLGWTLVCFGLAFHFRHEATLFGLAHLIGEGVFVGGLALLEWRFRDLLATA